VFPDLLFGFELANLRLTAGAAEMTRLAAVSSVNCGLNVQPRALKKSIDLFRFFTGRLTKILVLMIAPFSWGGTAVTR
jgi:hypothetical protein